MSDSSIRTKPSIDEPSNMICPSSAFSNWLRGTSTFFTTPRMSVNWSRRNRTSSRSHTSRTSRLETLRAWSMARYSASRVIGRGRMTARDETGATAAAPVSLASVPRTPRAREGIGSPRGRGSAQPS
jgi:hypothetical protein